MIQTPTPKGAPHTPLPGATYQGLPAASWSEIQTAGAAGVALLVYAIVGQPPNARMVQMGGGALLAFAAYRLWTNPSVLKPAWWPF